MRAGHSDNDGLVLRAAAIGAFCLDRRGATPQGRRPPARPISAPVVKQMNEEESGRREIGEVSEFKSSSKEFGKKSTYIFI
jgi:hypothetical protein